MTVLTSESAELLEFPTAAGAIPGSARLYYEMSTIIHGREVRTIWTCDRDGGDVRQVAAGMTNPRSAAPSPDGLMIAYVADVDGVGRIWVEPVAGGASTPIKSPPYTVSGAPAWSPDSRHLAMAAVSVPPRDRSVPYLITRESFRYEGIGLIDDAVQDIYLVDVETGNLRRLTDDRAIDSAPRWSPDGRSVLYLQSFRPDEEWTAKPALRVADVMDIGGGRHRAVVPDSWGGVLAAEWTASGDIVIAGTRARPGTADMFFSKQDLWLVAEGAPPRLLTEALPTGIGTWLEFDNPTYGAYRGVRFAIDDELGEAVVSVQLGGDVSLARVAIAGDRAPVVSHVPQAVHLVSDVDAVGGVVFITSTIVAPPQISYAPRGVAPGDAQTITRLNNAILLPIALPEVRRFEVTVDQDTILDAWALLPSGDGPFPMVLCIHGGPSDAYGNTYMIDHQLLIGRGIGVVFSNFRGSGGYGNDFHAALDGRWGPVGEIDHLATLDRAIELGYADPDRVGVYGLSHGGFAAMWLIGRSDRFKAAVAENGVADFITEAATIDAPWWLEPELADGLFSDLSIARELSPIEYADSVDAPTLFIVGENDVRCPPSESENFFRALKHRGVTAEMLRLPGAGHVGSYDGPPAVRRAQNEGLIDWFERFLLKG